MRVLNRKAMLSTVAFFVTFFSATVVLSQQTLQVDPAIVQEPAASPVDPGWYAYDGEAISSDDARTVLGEPDSSYNYAPPPPGVSSSTFALPSDYTQLAEALENDPLRIYQYVRNHFEYVPYYGLLKGPYLTLHERSGNDFDQASLLVEVLRAAGYTANFRYGEAIVSTSNTQQMADIAAWLGTDQSATIIRDVFSNGGVPVSLSGGTLKFDRLWVEVDIGGTIVSLDPAYKLSSAFSGIDLDAAMGFNEAALLAAAGGTIGTDSIQNVSVSGLADHLNARANQLKAYLAQNHANDRVEDIVGGYEVIQDNGGALPSSLPLSVTPDFPAWTAIPSNYIAEVQLVHGGIDTTFEIPEIAGRKLSIRYTSTTVIPDPPAGATDFGSVAVGGVGQELTLTQGNSNPFTIQLTASIVGTNSSAFEITQGTGTQNIPTGGSVDVKLRLTGVGQTSGRKNATLRLVLSASGATPFTQDIPITGVVESRVAEIYIDDVLQVSEGTPTGNLNDLVVSVDHPYAAQSGGFADQSVTFNLVRNGAYVLASGFGGDQDSTLLAERQRRLNRMSLDGTPSDSPEIYSETLNVIGQTWLQQTQLNNDMLCALSKLRCMLHHRFGIVGQEEGYFVDVKAQLTTTPDRSSASLDGGFQSDSLVASAMEHSVLEQLQGTDNPGISTIKIFSINNTNGGKLYLANQSNYSSSIRAQLSNYSSTQLDQFQTLVNGGSTLILPENGAVTLNDWSGIGYIDYKVSGVNRSIGMIIGGGLNGGFASTPQFISPPVTYQEFFPEIVPPVNINRNFALDPVDLNSGAFVSQVTDLALGSGGVRGLSFARSYDSHQVAQNPVGLGRGWTHNYNIYLNNHSDVESALGDGTPFQALPVIVANHVMRNLMESLQPSLKNWAVGALTANWVTDQLLNKSMSIHTGAQVSTYRELPDGTFVSPAGQTAELVRLGDDTFELRERFGTVLKFNTDNRIASITDIDGNALSFTYSGDKLIQVVDPHSRAISLGYTGDNLTSVSDSTGRTVTYSQTGDDLTGVTGLESASWQYSYDGLHRLETVVNPESITIVDNTYDDFDRVTQQVAPRDTGNEIYKLHYSGFTSSEESPSGDRLTYHYDVNGRTVAVEDAEGNISRTQYDGQGQVIEVTDPRGNSTVRRYDAFNNLIEIIDANTQGTDFIYDAQHRLIRTVDPLGHDSETDYDVEHHPTNLRDALDNEVVTSYRADGLVNTITDARNVVTTQTYDSLGQLNTSQTASEPAIDSDYNNRGLLTSLTDQAGAQTQFIYDDRGLVTTRTDALGKMSTSIYDDLGQLTSKTDRNGNTTSLTYTASGKVDTITYPEKVSDNVLGLAEPSFTVDFGYDSKDRLVSMVDQHGTTSNVYDSVDRITSQTDANGHQIQYSYDAAGNVTQLTYPDGKTVSYSYDALNRIADVTVDWLSVSATPSYDNAGRLTGITHFNDTATTYSYDNANRLTGLTHYNSDNETLADYLYTLDANGNRTQETITNEPILPALLINATATKTYNTEKNRLVSASVNGPITDPVSFFYDDEGLTEVVYPTAGGLAGLYAADGAGRITLQGFGSGLHFFKYDGVGNRISATRASMSIDYVYDANGNLLAELDDQGVILRYYIHGLGLMAMVEASTGELYVYHFDGTGHTVAMTDDDEKITHRYAYAPYGKTLAKEELVAQPFTYAGQVGIYTEEDDVYYMRARYYDANLQQFVSEDPAGFNGGINLYAYAIGNPIKYVDPTGEVPLVVLVPLVGGAVSGGFAAADAFFEGGNVLNAFGTGFVSGAAGSLAGLTPIVGPALGGAVGNATSQLLSGDDFSYSEVVGSAALGPIANSAAGKIVPIKPGTFQPSLFKPRTSPKDFGPNTRKTLGQAGAGSAIGSGIGNIGK